MSYIAGSGMQLIAKNVLGSATATITFSSIPANFNHLKLICMGRFDRAASINSAFSIRINSDSGGNYNRQLILGANAAAIAGYVAANTYAFLDDWPAATATASYSAAGVIDIPVYAGTTFYKNIIYTGGQATDSAPNSEAMVTTVIWKNTAAITGVSLLDGTGASNFITGSAFYLYGII